MISILCASAPLALAVALAMEEQNSAVAPDNASAASGLRAPRELSAIEVFDLAEKAKAAGQPDDALRFYDALTQDRDGDIRAEARFRKGMLLAEQGRYREAAQAFRALLDEKPDAARVRLELARLLALLGEESGARRELRQAQAADLPEPVAQMVGQFDASLRSRKSAGLTLELGLAPDTNINRATEVRTLNTVIAPLTLSRDARAQSGVGFHWSGQAYAKGALAPGVKLVPRLNGLGTLYRQGQFNDVTVTTLLGLELQGKRDRLNPALGKGWRWYGGSPYMHLDMASVDWIHLVGRRSQMVTSIGASTTDYLLNDLQDGALYSASIGIERALSSRSGISVTISGARQTAQDPGYATVSGGLRLLGWHEAGRTTLFASANLQRTEGDEALALFGDRRREWFSSVRAGATLRQLSVQGFAPYFRLGIERNTSTVALYDYRRFTSEFGITRAF